MRSGDRKELLMIRILIGIRFTQAPDFDSADNSCFREFQDPLPGSHCGRADQPTFSPRTWRIGKKAVLHSVRNNVEPFPVGLEKVYHKLSFPRGERDDCVCFSERLPSHSADEAWRQKKLCGSNHTFLRKQRWPGTRPCSCEEF